MKNIEQAISIPEVWHNYGDVNPKPHGGLFVRWEGDMWHIIETTNKNDLPMSEKGHMFEHVWLEPMDIWVNGDPYKGFTDRTKSELGTFSGLPFEVMEREDIPEGETYEDYVDWYMENYFNNLLGYLVHIHVRYIHGDPVERANDYWGYLEGWGINKEDF